MKKYKAPQDHGILQARILEWVTGTQGDHLIQLLYFMEKETDTESADIVQVSKIVSGNVLLCRRVFKASFYFFSFFLSQTICLLCAVQTQPEGNTVSMRPLGAIIRDFGQWDHHLAGGLWLFTFCSHSPRWYHHFTSPVPG